MAMPIAAFFVSLAAPAVRQVLVSLGIGMVTFVGLSAAVDALLQQSASSINSLPTQAAQLFGLAGGFEAMSIIAGGITFRVSMIALKRFRFL